MLTEDPEDSAGTMADMGLGEWYSSLSDRDKVRLERYLTGADRSSVISFLSSVASAAVAEENHIFAVTVCEECLNRDVSDIEKFRITESLIEAYIGAKRYDDAKCLCESNLALYPSVSDRITAENNGSVPEKMNCRNRYIDILVGIESGYDEAIGLLDRFRRMGLITEEDLKFRVQSLKIHRLQRSFDGVYTYTYKN